MAGKRRRIELSGGSYQTRAVTIAAQRVLNMLPEPVPQVADEPDRTYFVPTPGCQLYATAPSGTPIRGIYTASDNFLYVVAGNLVYQFQGPALGWTLIGGPLSTSTGPVQMVDDGTEMLLVEGSAFYYVYNMGTGVFTVAGVPGSGVATHIAYVDTYFIINDFPNPHFFVSDSNSSTFNALNFGAVASRAGYIQGLAIVHRNLWLITNNAAEVWYNAGGADFPFALAAGVFNDTGCTARYTIASTQDTVFWLGRTANGSAAVFAGNGTEAKPISTFAIAATLAEFALTDTTQVLDDCTGWCYEQGGHAFYVLNIPAPFNKTFVYDLATNQWHERAYTPDATTEQRHRGNNAAAFAAGVVVGDYQTGDLWLLDPTAGNDNGTVQKRVRSFPHAEAAGGERVVHHLFQADMSAFGEVDATIDLDWSDDGGVTWGTPVTQVMATVGNAYVTPTWRRLGYSRSRVYRLTWQADVPAVLSSAVIEVEAAET